MCMKRNLPKTREGISRKALLCTEYLFVFPSNFYNEALATSIAVFGVRKQLRLNEVIRVEP